jgi:hypothetical protein
VVLGLPVFAPLLCVLSSAVLYGYCISLVVECGPCMSIRSLYTGLRSLHCTRDVYVTVNLRLVLWLVLKLDDSFEVLLV